MNPIDQTTFTPSTDAPPEERGNCLQAAVASLLDLPLADVPHFAAEEDWFGCYGAFAASRGCFIVQTTIPVDGAYGIGFGKSPRGEYNHAVVSFGGEVAHDPHPSRDGLRTWEGYEYFVPLDPARVGL